MNKKILLVSIIFIVSAIIFVLFNRAFSVLLFDKSGRLLLQKRASHKITFPNVWANSCCSHPLYSDEEMETRNHLGVKSAAIRKLEQELGIDPSQVSID